MKAKVHEACVAKKNFHKIIARNIKGGGGADPPPPPPQPLLVLTHR